MAHRIPRPYTKLTLQQRIFVEHYVTSGPYANATKSAAYAKYKMPHISGNDLLTRKPVIEFIDKMREETRMRNNITIDDLINEYAKIAFADPRELYDEDGNLLPIHKLNDVLAGAISTIEQEEIRILGESVGTLKKIKRYDKMTALNALREMLGFKSAEMIIRRGPDGRILETEETVNPDEHKVIFEDNTEDKDED